MCGLVCKHLDTRTQAASKVLFHQLHFPCFLHPSSMTQYSCWPVPFSLPLSPLAWTCTSATGLCLRTSWAVASGPWASALSQVPACWLTQSPSVLVEASWLPHLRAAALSIYQGICGYGDWPVDLWCLGVCLIVVGSMAHTLHLPSHCLSYPGYRPHLQGLVLSTSSLGPGIWIP